MKRNNIAGRLSLFIVLLPALGLTACGNDASQKEKHIVSEAKMDSYESAEELQADASVVVRVEKTGQEENIVEKMGGNSHFGYTKSMVEVKEIMKNISHQPIEIGDEILVEENQFSYKDKDGTKVTSHLSRYKKMEPGKEYFLYLNYSQHDEWFYVLSGLFGKVPVSTEEDLLVPSSDITLYDGQPYEDDYGLDEMMENIRAGSLALYQ